MNVLDVLKEKLNYMGFSCQKIEGGLLCHVPTFYFSFKLYYSPAQRLILFKPDRYSTALLLRNLIPKLQAIAESLGLKLLSL